VVRDARGRIGYANAQAAALLGAEMGHILGRRADALLRLEAPDGNPLLPLAPTLQRL